MVDHQPRSHNPGLLLLLSFHPPLLSSLSSLSQRSSSRQIEFLPRICLSSFIRPAWEWMCARDASGRKKKSVHVCFLALLSHLKANLSVRQRSSWRERKRRPWAAALFDRDGPGGNKWKREEQREDDRWLDSAASEKDRQVRNGEDCGGRERLTCWDWVTERQTVWGRERDRQRQWLKHAVSWPCSSQKGVRSVLYRVFSVYL